jgi:hypothetical protein
VKYLLQIYSEGAMAEGERLSKDEQDAIVDEYRALLEDPGVVGGERLQPPDMATTVQVRGGQTLLTDGAFVEAKEHIGGFMIIEADELDGALEIAARIPAARMGGAVEVRPVMEQ